MEDAAVQAKTNGQFVEMLLIAEASQASEAKSLLNDFYGFKAWLQLPATRESIESVAQIFSTRVSASLDSLKSFEVLYREKIENINEFLRLLCRIAFSDFGIEIDLEQALDSLSGLADDFVDNSN